MKACSPIAFEPDSTGFSFSICQGSAVPAIKLAQNASNLGASRILICVFVSQSSEHGACDDLEIQSKTPVANVVQIMLEPVRD